jgi:hypothetical protein
MGITNFYKWIKSSYNKCINPIGKKCYDHVYIDLNYLLHMCYYNCDNLDIVIKKLSTIILDICAKTQPRYTVNLYGDGTAPFAKLCIQRERRFSSKDELSLNFTPGTTFITSIPQKLAPILEIIKNRFNVKINIDTNEPGEAEIKIKYKILEHYKQNNISSHILATNDADVILILASHESYNRCNILLHDDVLSISQLIKSHTQKYGMSLFPYLDFCFLNLFMGNDYLPKLNLITVEKLWLCYRNNLDLYQDKYLVKIESSNIIINKNLLIDILNSVICNINIGRLKKIHEHYDETLYENYFYGLMWNIYMYHNGICCDYYYMCNKKKSIDILNLLTYIYSHMNSVPNVKNKSVNLQLSIDKTQPIPTQLCSILLLPQSGIHLIDEIYISFIQKIKNNINIHDDKYKINKTDLDIIMQKFNKFNNSQRMI